MSIDLGICRAELTAEMVNSYESVVLPLNNILDCSHNTGSLHSKGQSRLHPLRSFGVQIELLNTVEFLVASTIFYGVL